MERKDFLRNSIGLFGSSLFLLEACKKDDTASNGNSSSGCSEAPAEVEGPYPYPSGEINNPLNRTDIRESQTGLPLSISFVVTDANNACAVVPNARVDIWHCNKDGYYSGYGSQTGGALGTDKFTDSLNNVEVVSVVNAAQGTPQAPGPGRPAERSPRPARW